MSIKFNYIRYEEKFYTYFEDKKEWYSPKHLFIFNDNRMRDIFIKKMGSYLFSESPVFITLEELKERIFLTDKIVLKEAKRILAFFKSIPQEIKEDLNIENYFDVIDFANNFFSYYEMLNLSCSEKLKKEHKWQRKYLDYFKKIKKEFDILALKYNYIPSDWIENLDFYNDSWISKFEKIIFIDIVEYPTLYKKILEQLSKKMDIIISLQMPCGDFNENELKLEKCGVPILNYKPKVYFCEKDIQEAIYLIKQTDKEKINVYSPGVENNNFYQLFPNDFAQSKRDTMNDTMLYKFLNIQLKLLLSREEKLGKVYLLKEFIDGLEEKVFRDYYDINQEEFIELNNLIALGYKYISKQNIEQLLEKIADEDIVFKVKQILYDLDEITAIDSVESLNSYLLNVIELNKFLETDYDNVDILEKMLEILGIIKSNETMEIYLNPNEIFGNRQGEGFYRILIQYMKDIVIKSNIKYPQDILLIKPFDFIRYAEENNKNINYFIDITDEYIPKILRDKIFLTEIQKKEIGYQTQEELRIIEKYRFYQTICCQKNTVIITRYDEEKAIGIAPFLEEFITNNEITLAKIPVEIDEVEKVIDKFLEGNNITVDNKEGSFEKNESDFQDKSLTLGAYDITLLKECPLKFYFSKLKKLDYVKKYEGTDLDPRILGIIVHKVLEDIVKNIWKDALKGDINIESQDVELMLRKEFKKERDKIEIHMDNYILEILIPVLKKNIVYFFNLLKKNYKNQNIKRFQSEKRKNETIPYYSGKLDVYLTGRADLVVETDIHNLIIDYKTGGNNSEQLDYYSILLYEHEDGCKKAFFNVWTGEYKEIDKVSLTKEELDNIIIEFSNSSNFQMCQQIKNCNSCMYNGLCRREE